MATSKNNVIDDKTIRETARVEGIKKPIDEAIQAADGAMMDVLTLIHAVADLNETGGCLGDDSMTNPQSRITALLIMARDKTTEAIRNLDVAHG